jgi:hypothetical protein
MMKELNAVLVRSSDTLVEDAAGMVSLALLLLVALHLPGVF